LPDCLSPTWLLSLPLTSALNSPPRDDAKEDACVLNWTLDETPDEGAEEAPGICTS
jgi:hypothetical protein